MTQEDLRRLRGATDAAISAIESRNEEAGEPINWADLGCVQAAWVVTDDNQGYAEVLIEEAAPDCAAFQAAVAAELEKRGWPGVRVVTEW